MILPMNLRETLSLGIASANRLAFPWKRLLWFDLLLLAFLILGTRLATLLHEVLGHALTAVLSGGDVTSVRISLLGGGRVTHHLPELVGVPVRFLVAWAGIGVNLATGALVFFQFSHSRPHRLRDGFWILFAGASLLGGVAYAALGLYYGQGDPVAWMAFPSPMSVWFSIPFLLAAPFLGFVAVKTYSAWAAQWFPAGSLAGRALVLLLTAGVATAAYAGLYTASGARSRALDSPQAALEQTRKEVARQQLEALVQAVRRMQPDLSEEQVRALIRIVPTPMQPVEVPRKPPLKPALALLYVVGAFFAVRRALGASTAPARLPPRAAAAVAALAAGVLVLLGLTGGWIYKAPVG